MVPEDPGSTCCLISKVITPKKSFAKTISRHPEGVEAGAQVNEFVFLNHAFVVLTAPSNFKLTISYVNVEQYDLL